MSRYLFVVPPLAGHVSPANGVASELQRRGHEVAWVAHEAVVGSLLGPGAKVYPAGDGFLASIAEHLPERERLRGPAALPFLWERVLVPLARDMADPVRVAVDDFGPGVVVADQQAFAGGLVAAERGLPWAVSASTSADLGGSPAMLPKVGEWMRRQITGLCEELWGSADDGFDPRYSPYLMLVYSTPAFVGELADEGRPLAFVGPVLPEPARVPEPFPWDWLDGHEANVLVTLGTVSSDVGERFLRRAVDAVSGKRYGVVMVGPERLQEGAGSNVLVRERVPQLDLLPRLDAVVCHGGHNTTVEALAAGLPLVCAPIRDDQPIVAAQVVQAGVGLRIGFGRARAADISAALETVLDDPSFRDSAGRIAETFRDAGGASAAADHLETLG